MRSMKQNITNTHVYNLCRGHNKIMLFVWFFFPYITTAHEYSSCWSRKRKTHATFRTSQPHTIIIHVDPGNGKLTLLTEHHNYTRYYSCRSRKWKNHAAFTTSQLHTIIIHVDSQNSRCFHNITATHNFYSCRFRKRKTHAAFRTSQPHTIIIHVDLGYGKLTLLFTSKPHTITIYVDPGNWKLTLLSQHHNHTQLLFT